MNVSVIIPTIGAHDLIAKARAGIPDGVQVIIADDPVSFAENCNTGAQYASGDILVFLNDDTEPQDGWLDAMLPVFAYPNIGIAGAHLIYPDGRTQHAGIYLERSGG